MYSQVLLKKSKKNCNLVFCAQLMVTTLLTNGQRLWISYSIRSIISVSYEENDMYKTCGFCKLF